MEILNVILTYILMIFFSVVFSNLYRKIRIATMKKIKGVHIKEFYEQIDQKYKESFNEALETKKMDDFRRIKTVMKLKDMNPEHGFLWTLIRRQKKRGHLDTVDNMLKFLGYDLRDEKDLDFIHMVIIEEVTFKYGFGAKKCFDEMVNDYYSNYRDELIENVRNADKISDQNQEPYVS